MNIQDIRAFVAVAETGSVSRAAMRLNLTQPAVTRRIQSFEVALGEGLVFDRSVKPAALTPAGRHVLEHCRRVLSAVAELEACATNAVDPSGELRAGVAHGLGALVLTTPLDAVQRAFPRIRLQISSNWSSGLVDEVRGGALDCAVGLLTDAHTIPAGVSTIPLGPEQIVIVSRSKASVRKDGTPWRLRELADEDWYLNPVGCGCRAALERAFGLQELPLMIAAEVFGEDLQLSLVARGAGLALMPRRLFEQSPHCRQLRMLEVVDFAITATVALIRPTMPGRFDPVIKVLVNELRARFEGPSIYA